MKHFSLRHLVSLTALLTVFVFTVIISASKISDPDTMQYLASGRYIVQHGLPDSCVFTHTINSCITVYSEWLLHLGIYYLYLLGGWNGLVIFQIIVACAITTLLIIYNLKKGINPVVAASFCWVSLFAASGRFRLRADFVSLLFLSVFYLLFSYFDAKVMPALRKRIILLAGIFLTMAVWTNIHGSFPLVFLIVAAFIFSRFIKTLHAFIFRLENFTQNWQRFKWFLIVMAVCVAASLFNPYGIRAFLWPFQNTIATMGDSVVASINEYQSPWTNSDFESIQVRFYKGLALFAGLILLVNVKRLRLPEVIILLLFFGLSVQAYRYVALFSVMAAFIIPRYFSYVKLPPKGAQIIKNVFCILLIIGSVYFGRKIVNDTLYMNNLIVRSFGLGLYPLAFPLGGARFIKENDLTGEIFNSYSYGAYLNWALYPSYKTFIHGAVLDPTILESKQLYKYYLGVSLGKIDMSDLTKRYGVTILLLDYKAETDIEMIDKLLSDTGWKLVYADFSSLLFIANLQQNKHIINAHPVNLYDADTLIPDYLLQQNNSIW